MADILLYNSIMEETERYKVALEENSRVKANAAFLKCSFDPQFWTALPYDDTNYDPTRELYVCDTSGCWNCGASCTWTVPAGATTAMFQLWGAGGGTGPGCCCGGSTYGGTGGYVSAIVPVSEGDSYTLCAGCACCCTPSRGYTADQGSSQGSFACGPDATLCAAGACGGVYRQMQMIHGIGSTCRFRAAGSTDGGACICNSGGDYCFDNSCATYGVIGYTTDTELSYSASVTGDCACGLPVMYGVTCFDGNHYGYKIHAPVISPTHTVTAGTCDCCSTFTSGACCGGSNCRAECNIRQIYGSGGTYSHVMGGSNSLCGDHGRPGLVRVTWW